MDNKKKKDEDAKFEQLADMTARELVKHKRGYYIVDGDERILMPMQTALMHSDMSKMQQNIVLAVVSAMRDKIQEVLYAKQHGIMRDLFAEQEIADDPRPIKFKLLFKDFGVSTSNYSKLAAAMEMMSKIPVRLPYKGASGMEYTKTTIFCTVYIPTSPSYQKYCIVSMEKDVAEHLLRFDLGYLYVGKLTSWKMSTKYSERLYWYIKAHCNYGGVTVSMGELRKMFGAEDKFKKSGKFEERVLEPSAKEIKDLFLRGECECWFEYEKIYNDGRKRGEPDAIKFKIYSNKTNELGVKLNLIEEGIYADIRDTMLNDLHLSDFLIDKYMKMVNEQNKESFLTQLITLKIQLDEKEESQKPVKKHEAYIVKSINNFFSNKPWEKDETDGGNDSADSAGIDKHAKLSYSDRWGEILQKISHYRSDEQMRETFDNVTFDSFNPQTGRLVLCSIGRSVYEKIENTEEDFKLMKGFLKEYYNFRIFNWHVFNTRDEYLKYKHESVNQ